ncbi:4'-phosphopantetheinyl transferase family protein [Hymenobacter jeollabukensis]|uniref:4'-phosphopantetheinyl transferase superfamily protein n=1 Tax=Hymenobacter jeollabukensis TaxID=2025313 RepID=A0A5R8WPY4_9BACT|nr:4'-phosphopantetheinyl transferase superfamily protein [Hymenobacter jeollabukensis]TLM92376.1 4'-phosphopantetheinyl transferase superfamily protein [Hymenobacter jeollabukensis]
MPLHSLTPLPAATPTLLGIWHLTEPADSLLAQLPAPADYAALLPAGRDPQRPRQWLAGRTLAHTLLRELTDAPALIRNDAATGQPFVAGQPGFGVSLSHSGEWVAALLTERGRVGIDVEQVRPKARQLARKYLTDKELTDAGLDDVKHSLYWSAKETLYKLHSRRRLLFKEHIQLEPFALAETGTLTGHLLPPDEAPSRHRLGYEQLTTGCVLTWTFSPELPR